MGALPQGAPKVEEVTSFVITTGPTRAGFFSLRPLIPPEGGRVGAVGPLWPTFEAGPIGPASFV